MDHIRIKGAREHNLKNLDVTLPKNRLVVLTGLSGSGKSSLAFDTLYAEGQRRYVECLSAYARQFLDLMEKPDVDSIEGLSPAISIEQKSTSHNPRSTVGTVTEIYDYLRVLFARIGKPHCPSAAAPSRARRSSRWWTPILASPRARGSTSWRPWCGAARASTEALPGPPAGGLRARPRGREGGGTGGHGPTWRATRPTPSRWWWTASWSRPASRGASPNPWSWPSRRARGSWWQSHRVGPTAAEDQLFSERLSCPKCRTALPEIEPRLFSFNSPHGACPDCSGLGVKMELDPAKIVPNPSLSIAQGALAPWSWRAGSGTGRCWRAWPGSGTSP